MMHGMHSPDLRLATHAAGLRFADLPPPAVAQAKVFLLDTLGVGLAGGSVPEAAPLLAAMRGWGEGAAATVWGRRLRLPPGNAALMNAYQVHCQEYDCLHEGAVLHAMATLVPVLLAEAEGRGGVSGRELLAAIAAGVDVACTLGLAAKQGLRFFRPATSGGFGAVAGLARLRGFDPATTLAAFGHQLGQVSGTMQAHTEGSAVLPLQVGLNARAALQSCGLAAAGFPSLALPITGRFGYLPMFEGEWDLEPGLATLGQRWLVAELSHKPFPSGRATHGGIEGLMALRAAAGFTPDEVVEIVVTGPPLINHLVDRPPLPVPGANYARLCMPFVLAKVLQHGALDLSHYRGDALADPVTHALSLRVRMERDANPDPNALGPQVVTVRLTDGRVLRHAVPAMLASPARPRDRAAWLAKFRRCHAFAAEPLGPPEALIDMVDALEDMADVRGLLAPLTPG
jgi:2-methylcitrate dehydratase PrpD